MIRTLITGTGSYVPEQKVPNSLFESSEFYMLNQERIENPGDVIVEKFEAITGIGERRYITENQVSSDIGAIAAKRAIEDSGIDPETLDQIIVAHNFGDIKSDFNQGDTVPSLAARIKNTLRIQNPSCVAYDVLFGCPGWLQGVIQAEAYIKSGMAKKCLIIGTETLSRVIDPHDRDSMIYSDGAGACVVEAVETEKNEGVLSTAVYSHTYDEAYYLFFGPSNKPESDPNKRFIKMYGRKIYEYALSQVPAGMKACLDKAGASIEEVKKVFIHQANEKMDEAIIKRLFRLYGLREVPEKIMPMSIHEYGNSSVATVPTLLDRVIKGKIEGQSLEKGDLILLASVGAGMNVNAVAYRY